MDSGIVHRAWCFVPPSEVPACGEARPFDLFGEPVVLCRDASGVLTALSNVCTHRGALIAESPCRRLRCRYHGRRFDFSGNVLASPGFVDVPEEPLLRFSVAETAGMTFIADRPRFDLIEAVRVLSLPEGMVYEPGPVFETACAWPVWVENYLEGLHIPFVHPALARDLDREQYRLERHAWSNIQTLVNDVGRVTGTLLWLFPTLCLNRYDWGVSLNQVVPTARDRCEIRYSFWVEDPLLRAEGPGGALDVVEAEDQAIVASVQRGMSSRHFRAGALCPEEDLVAHFRELVASCGG